MKKLVVFDFDKTLFKTFSPEDGKLMWSKFYGKSYPHIGWWSKAESLDLNVFDIKPYDNMLERLLIEVNNVESKVIILTSRIYKLRSEVQLILDKYNINVNVLDMKSDDKDKGERLLTHILNENDLIEIDVYDDNYNDILSYKKILNKLPKNIKFNIFVVNDGNFNLINNFI